MSKALIVYFSRTGENYVGGKIRRLEIGNTKIAAQMLQKVTGADLFEIQMAQPYPDGYMACIQEAKKDLEENVRLQLVSFPDSIDGYDTIYLCYPNYWGTMPMAVWTFLEHFDFSGKTIKPLCTNEGSGMGRSEADLKKLCPGAKVEKGLPIVGGEAAKAQSAIAHWA
mgnify:FL=1